MVLTCRWCRYFYTPKQQLGQSRSIQHVYILVRPGIVTKDRTDGAIIALQLTIGGEYDGDWTTASSHLDSSLSRSFAAIWDKNDDHGAVIRLCTDSLQCTTSPHEWGVYWGSVW